MITVLEAGEFTTIQDTGRWGYQAFGLPIAGAMDSYACRAANLLVGNAPQAAVLEMTACGGSFKFDSEQLVAVCGADMQGRLNDKRISNWSAFWVPKRGELRFGQAVCGCRTYLAVRGGLDVPIVLGSRSTDTRAKIGGYQGRNLRLGDILYIGRDEVRASEPRVMPEAYVPRYAKEIVLRVVLGPQDHLFAAKTLHTFFSAVYTVAGKVNREGCLLTGPKLFTLTKEADLVSDAVGLGAIQIPASGLPFIVTADHQTTRGFPKPGYVIRADLSKLAQARPGDIIRFVPVSEAAAIQALEQEKRILDSIIRL